MIYICTDCGREFDEPREIRESHGLPGGFYETFTECPFCGGNYEEQENEE